MITLSGYWCKLEPLVCSHWVIQLFKLYALSANHMHNFELSAAKTKRLLHNDKRIVSMSYTQINIYVIYIVYIRWVWCHKHFIISYEFTKITNKNNLWIQCTCPCQKHFPNTVCVCAHTRACVWERESTSCNLL